MDAVKKEFLEKYLAEGDEKFYKFLIFFAISRMTAEKIQSPDLELLKAYDSFLFLYRRGGDINHLNIARVLRRAAHKVYRMLLKKNKDRRNAKFLNLV